VLRRAGTRRYHEASARARQRQRRTNSSLSTHAFLVVVSVRLLDLLVLGHDLLEAIDESSELALACTSIGIVLGQLCEPQNTHEHERTSASASASSERKVARHHSKAVPARACVSYVRTAILGMHLFQIVAHRVGQCVRGRQQRMETAIYDESRSRVARGDKKKSRGTHQQTKLELHTGAFGVGAPQLRLLEALDVVEVAAQRLDLVLGLRHLVEEVAKVAAHASLDIRRIIVDAAAEL